MLRAARELHIWRALAETMPLTPLRHAALHSLDTKRGYADGAALFTILPRHRDPTLLRALVAYESIVDYLDNVSEGHQTFANGQQLHLALIDALDPRQPLRDYYRHSPWRQDGGYLVALVEACRAACRDLISYERLRPHLLREARRGRVLGLNHELDGDRRDAGLRAWARDEYPGEHALTWWELSGSASATLYIHALLALAAVPGVSDDDIAAVRAAHWPWIALATTLLDSYVDWTADQAAGQHCYLDHYPDRQSALLRTRESVTAALRQAHAAPRGHRHAVIVACMVALYLSADPARCPELRDTTATLEAAGGQLVRLLVPILRTWRAINRQRS